jgi:hypothetical protein
MLQQQFRGHSSAKAAQRACCFHLDMALKFCAAPRFCLRLRSKVAALPRPDIALLAIISDLLSYSQVSTWRATVQWAAQCVPAALSACGGAETCQGDAIDDDGMAGLPDVEHTLNVFLR